ncbi:hypothetical protein ES705_40990 [subsurface metagenome]
MPSINDRIETFIKLSEMIGKEKVIWRFDPLILTNKIGIDELIKKVEKLGNQLKNYTNKLVISFADIKSYKKVQNNLRKEKIKYQEFNERLMHETAKGLHQLNENMKLKIATCAEKINLGNYGIQHNKCIDDELIFKLFWTDKKLMDFLGIRVIQQSLFDFPICEKTKVLKDKGQRIACGCIISKDIGQYNTCRHLCEYCYANTTKTIAIRNFQKHKSNPTSETITGV